MVSEHRSAKPVLPNPGNLPGSVPGPASPRAVRPANALSPSDVLSHRNRAPGAKSRAARPQPGHDTGAVRSAKLSGAVRSGDASLSEPDRKKNAGRKSSRGVAGPALRQARVRLVTVDDQQQASRVVFHVPHLRRGDEFCRVRTRPPTDVRRTRFEGHRIELIIYGAVFWRVGELTTLELEPYKATPAPEEHPAVGDPL
ncbi:MAG: hypothetical protein JO069_22555 [Verrucomicrobia bacterium]|nr:hypothetical protein [Verrucomicrobiota bacterium]